MLEASALGDGSALEASALEASSLEDGSVLEASALTHPPALRGGEMTSLSVCGRLGASQINYLI